MMITSTHTSLLFLLLTVVVVVNGNVCALRNKADINGEALCPIRTVRVQDFTDNECRSKDGTEREYIIDVCYPEFGEHRKLLVTSDLKSAKYCKYNDSFCDVLDFCATWSRGQCQFKAILNWDDLAETSVSPALGMSFILLSFWTAAVTMVMRL